MLDKEIRHMFEAKIKEKPETMAKILKNYQGDRYLIVKDPSGKKLNIDIKPYFSQIFEALHEDIIYEFIASWLWQYLIHGEIKYIVQETPPCKGDNDIIGNDELLKSYITRTKGGIIDASFWGGTQGQDGNIEFKDPPIKEKRNFPVEFGYCTASQFYHNIMSFHSIARLPYRSEHIIYFEWVGERFNLVS